MKIYLCASYERRDELRGYRDQLEILGHEVTSRWLDETFPLKIKVDDLSQLEASLIARKDLVDVKRSDLLVAFTENPGTSRGRGGRHVEYGVAIAIGISRIIIGPRENIFCCLSDSRLDYFDELLGVINQCSE
jgi:hypothetical protein